MIKRAILVLVAVAFVNVSFAEMVTEYRGGFLPGNFNGEVIVVQDSTGFRANSSVVGMAPNYGGAAQWPSLEAIKYYVEHTYSNGLKVICEGTPAAVNLYSAGTGFAYFKLIIAFQYDSDPPNNCTCGACCSDKCTCGKWSGATCGQTAEDCECHADDNNCTCGACCSDKCTCGKWSGKDCCGECDDICVGHATDITPCHCHHDDNENQCVCGACCIHKCTCGKWTGVSCSGSCAHNCTQDHPHNDYQDCECHHPGPGDGGGCCEHHKKDFVAPPGISIPVIEEPNWQFPNRQSTGIGYDVPPVPLVLLPIQLKWFELGGDYGLPTSFKFDELKQKFEEKLSEKVPTEWVDTLKDLASSPSWSRDISWTIDTTILGVKVGPHRFDIGDEIDRFAVTNESRILRLIILAFVTIIFIMSVLKLFLKQINI